MTEPLTSALKRLRSEFQELDGLTTHLRTTPLLFDLRRLPPRPRGFVAPEEDQEEHEAQASLDARHVLEGWKRGGAAWLAQLGRRDLSAVAGAVGHPTVGPLLTADAAFVEALVPRLRLRRQVTIVSRMWFHQYPPSGTLVAQFARVREAVPVEQQPRWWSWTDSGPDAVARRIADALRLRAWLPFAEAEELPDEASGHPWSTVVCRVAYPSEVDHAERLLRYADRGIGVATPAPLPPGAATTIRELVAIGVQSPHNRLRIVALLRRRLGDVFGGAEAAGWRGLEAERAQVRSWVAGEILDVLFKHLVPDNDAAHQTEPRRVFWRRYTHRVERLWLLVERSLRRRLDASDVRDVLERCGEVVEVRELEGSTERAIVWMQLRTASGGVVSVIDGNANTTFRARSGAFAPGPGRHAVNYGSEIVSGVFSERAGAVERKHAGRWEGRITSELGALGVWP